MKQLITNTRTLEALAQANKIVWPVMTNNSKGIPFKYVDEIESVGMSFTHKGVNYKMQYHSGCFYPYLYSIS